MIKEFLLMRAMWRSMAQGGKDLDLAGPRAPPVSCLLETVLSDGLFAARQAAYVAFIPFPVTDLNLPAAADSCGNVSPAFVNLCFSGFAYEKTSAVLLLQ